MYESTGSWGRAKLLSYRPSRGQKRFAKGRKGGRSGSGSRPNSERQSALPSCRRACATFTFSLTSRGILQLFIDVVRISWTANLSLLPPLESRTFWLRPWSLRLLISSHGILFGVGFHASLRLGFLNSFWQIIPFPLLRQNFPTRPARPRHLQKKNISTIAHHEEMGFDSPPADLVHMDSQGAGGQIGALSSCLRFPPRCTLRSVPPRACWLTQGCLRLQDETDENRQKCAGMLREN